MKRSLILLFVFLVGLGIVFAYLFLELDGDASVVPANIDYSIEERALPEPSLAQGDVTFNIDTKTASEDEERDIEMEEFRAYLESSSDPDDQLLSIWFSRLRGEERISAWRNYLASYPDNKFALYLIISDSYGDYDSHIDTAAELLRLKRIDSENAVIDELLAMRASYLGDEEKAFEHFTNASNAKESNDYYQVQLSMMGDAYLRKDGYLSASTLENVYGYGGAVLYPAMGVTSQLCKNAKIERPKWVDACKARMRGMMSKSITLSEVSLGRGMYAEYFGGEQLRDEYRIENQLVGNELITATNVIEVKRKKPDFRVSQDTWHEYMRIFSEQGEVEALKYFAEAL